MIPSTETIQRAAEILRQIQSLQAELAGLFTGGRGVAAIKRRGRPPGSGKAAATPAPQGSTKKRRMSAEGRARIAAAAKARWAKFHAGKTAKR